MTNEQKRIQADIDTLMTAQNLRIEQEHQKERNKTALNWLAGFLIIGTALVCLVGYAKCTNEQAAKEKELSRTIECK